MCSPGGLGSDGHPMAAPRKLLSLHLRMIRATTPPAPPTGGATRARRPRRRFGAAEEVARRLREHILSGALDDGALLPKIDDLSAEFGVSRAAIREACLILEAEGLLSVQRGNVGGAIVHLPTAEHAAYSLSLVLQAGGVPLSDVRTAIERFEPLCVELCAERADRATTVLPALEASQQAYAAALEADDGEAAVTAARAWHEAIVLQCGNATTVASLGTLERVWTSHLRASAAKAGLIAHDDAARTLTEHQRIQELIARGDAAGAAEAARAHMRTARVHHTRDDELTSTVRAETVRDAGLL